MWPRSPHLWHAKTGLIPNEVTSSPMLRGNWRNTGAFGSECISQMTQGNAYRESPCIARPSNFGALPGRASQPTLAMLQELVLPFHGPPMVSNNKLLRIDSLSSGPLLAEGHENEHRGSAQIRKTRTHCSASDHHIRSNNCIYPLYRAAA